MHEIFLETERLYLRRFTAEDAPLLHDLDSDPEVMRYISLGVPTPLERIENDFLPRILGDYERYEHLGFWAAHERATDRFVGWFLFRPFERAPDEIELGYRLRRDAWGKGYATEGSRALIEKAFGEWGVEKVVATALLPHRASQHVMAKCGLRPEMEYLEEGPLASSWSKEDRRAIKYALRREDYVKQPTAGS